MRTISKEAILSCWLQTDSDLRYITEADVVPGGDPAKTLGAKITKEWKSGILVTVLPLQAGDEIFIEPENERCRVLSVTASHAYPTSVYTAAVDTLDAAEQPKGGTPTNIIKVMDPHPETARGSTAIPFYP